MDDEDSEEDRDASWLNAKPYDADVPREVEPAGKNEMVGGKEVGDYSWLQQGSLFDKRQEPSSARGR